MAENSRMSKLSEKEDECVFSWKLFSGWDFMIGNAETAQNRIGSIILGLKEALLEESEKHRDARNWKITSVRIIVNLIVFAMLLVSAYAVVEIVDRENMRQEAAQMKNWWRQHEVSIVLGLITYTFPIFFEILGMIERHHPRKQLRFQLGRIMILNLLNSYSLIYALFKKINSSEEELQSLKPKELTSTLINCYNKLVSCEINNNNLLTTTTTTTTAMAMMSLILNSSSINNINTTTTTVPIFSLYNGTDYYPIFTTDLSLDTSRTIKDDDLIDLNDSYPHINYDYADIILNDAEDNNETYTNDKLRRYYTKNSTIDLLKVKPIELREMNEKSCKKIIVKCYERVCENKTNYSVVGNYSVSTLNITTRRKLKNLCWETMFGQELAKVTMVDLMLTFFTIMFLDFFRALFVRFFNNWWCCWDLEKQFPQYGDFKIAENILHLVNNQGMVWMGIFFSPGLIILNVAKLIILMYLRSWSVLTCNVPHEIVFRASRSNNFYLTLLLTMLFLCVLPVGYAITWVEPSWHCGPFSGYKRIYHLATESLRGTLPTLLFDYKVLDYAASPGIVIPIFVLMTLIIYYMISLTNSLRESNNDLKIQLRKERTEERRKMFKIVEKKLTTSNESTPFARWKKILPLQQSSIINNNNNVKSTKVVSSIQDNNNLEIDDQLTEGEQESLPTDHHHHQQSTTKTTESKNTSRVNLNDDFIPQIHISNEEAKITHIDDDD